MLDILSLLGESEATLLLARMHAQKKKKKGVF